MVAGGERRNGLSGDDGRFSNRDDKQRDASEFQPMKMRFSWQAGTGSWHGRMDPHRRPGTRTIASRHTRFALVVVLLHGCSHVERRPVPAMDVANAVAEVGVGANACAELLDATGPERAPSLAGSEFSIAVWNMQKGKHPGSLVEFDGLARDHDLVLLQEYAQTQASSPPGFSAFTPGFMQGATRTGVATFSRSRPLVHCGLNGWEPILRTPKATTITEFGLATEEEGASSEKTLVVVNLHAVNFSVGTVRFRQQISEAVQAVAGHDGPLIFTGDFNTWRAARSRFVQQKLAELSLAPVAFEDDQRVRVLGRHLDHVYVRGLEVVEATTRKVSTSDHNPMIVRLRL